MLPTKYWIEHRVPSGGVTERSKGDEGVYLKSRSPWIKGAIKTSSRLLVGLFVLSTSSKYGVSFIF